MTTALEEMERAQRRIESDVWGERLTYFIREYAPEDPYRRFEFERNLHSIIQQGWHEAQRPLLDRLTQIVSLMPSPFGSTK